MIAGLRTFINASIVKKITMAVTGLALVGFLVGHLVGNFLILVGSDAFNLYAYKLTSTPLIYVAEAILLLLFIAHMGLAARTTLENKSARGPISYYNRQKTGMGSTFSSSTMLITGFAILIFIVMHLLNFKFGTQYLTTVDGVQMRDLYRTVIEFFASPVNVGLYVLAMIALSIHLSHGIQSSFQTLGFNHPKYNFLFKKSGVGLAVFLAFGFSFLSIWCYFMGGM